MNYSCPVCAYPAMPYPAVPYNICPCCGTEFGVDNRFQSMSDIRKTWIAQRMPWFDDITQPPQDWSPSLQLIRGGYVADLVAPVGFVTKTETQTVEIVDRRVFPSLSDLHIATPLGAAA